MRSFSYLCTTKLQKQYVTVKYICHASHRKTVDSRKTNKQTNPQTWNHCRRSEDLRGFLPYFIWHADKVPCV